MPILISAHSDCVKLSKKSSEKVDTQKQREKFFEDPWKFGKQVLDGVESSGEVPGEPKFSKENCKEFFKSKYVDANRDYEYVPQLKRAQLPGKKLANSRFVRELSIWRVRVASLTRLATRHKKTRIDARQSSEDSRHKDMSEPGKNRDQKAKIMSSAKRDRSPSV